MAAAYGYSGEPGGGAPIRVHPSEDHVCHHEKDIILLNDRTADMASDLKQVISILRGNDERVGVVTKIELLKESVKRLWVLNWFVFGIITSAVIAHLLGA